MRKIGLVIVMVLFVKLTWASGYSILTCSASQGTVIQVSLNGKLVNTNPREVVRLKSKKGCNSLSVLIIDRVTGREFSVQKDIHVDTGYEVYLSVEIDECGPRINISRRYPLFSNYLYNKNLYAVQNIS
jgi:hypothetical protein